MSEQVLRNGNAMARSKTRTITQIAMLGAIAGIFNESGVSASFPGTRLFISWIFQKSRYWLVSFAMGPIAGVLIELVKILCIW